MIKVLLRRPLGVVYKAGTWLIEDLTGLRMRNDNGKALDSAEDDMKPKTTFGYLCTLLVLLTAAGCTTGSPGGSATSLPVSSATSLPSSSAIELTSTALAGTTNFMRSSLTRPWTCLLYTSDAADE